MAAVDRLPINASRPIPNDFSDPGIFIEPQAWFTTCSFDWCWDHYYTDAVTSPSGQTGITGHLQLILLNEIHIPVSGVGHKMALYNATMQQH